MLQTSVRIATAVTLAAIAIVAVTVDARADDDSRVVVRLYDTSASDAATREAAIRTAAAIVAEAGIDIDWRDCTDRSAQPICRDAHGWRDLIVRIMPEFVPGTALRKSSVEALKSLDDAEPPLGFAVIDPHTHIGTMATIFRDQVWAVARRTGVDSSELLGRALAHEIGHLLLRAPGHSRTGLMRAVWTDAELMLNRSEDWVFAPLDRRRLQP
ncbi:MAG TPA: hypothetical protein VI485_20960 [Vicinamibacterales bacterium]|nr:hypothetical protein [Vicinamibacterales bacterium]